MIDLTTAFAVSISEGNARISIFVAEHIYQSVLRHRVGKLTAGLRVGRSSNIVPKPDIMVKIPIISLGECVIWLLEHDNNGGLVADLQTLVKAKLQVNTPPPDDRSYKIAFELMSDDERMKPTDTLIVAQALADHTSEWLITTDLPLLNNKTVFDKIDDVASKLKISDRFTKRGAGKNVR